MTQHLDALMQKEMTRKQFLATMGFGVVSIFGFSTIVQLLTGKHFSAQHVSKGYGSTAYGGRSEQGAASPA